MAAKRGWKIVLNESFSFSDELIPIKVQLRREKRE